MGAIKHGAAGTAMVVEGRTPRRKGPVRNKDECPGCRAGKRSRARAISR